jgi:signal peptidase II
VTSLQKKWIVFTGTAAFVVLLDQWSKYMVRTRWELQNLDLIPGWLSFHYTKNPGMALGIDILQTSHISIIAIIATIAIVIYIARSVNKSPMAFLFLMGLVIGGAIGNLIDRLFIARIMGYGTYLEGHVVDFIHFTLRIGNWPVFPYIFNVADMAISSALIFFLLFNKRFVPQDESESSAARAPRVQSGDASGGDAPIQARDTSLDATSESADTTGSKA